MEPEANLQPEAEHLEGRAALENSTLKEPRKPMYVVVNNGGKCRRLHKSLGGCWMGREKNFKSSVDFFILPDPCEYTHYCKVCWPKTGPVAVDTDSDSSSSTSSSKSSKGSSDSNSE